MAAVPSTGRASGVERAAAPEADATRALYERYAGQLYGFCLNRLGSREEAEDAVQTTFLNAFRGLRRGIVPEAEGAWLYKIAENVCLTRHRSAWRRGRVESPSDMQALQDVTPARDAGAGEELIPLGDALAAMPDTQRRAILLREWQGLSYREIATELDVSQSAVETLIFRARRSLANALETPWQERRAAGRRAFDLGSLLAAVKALFAGGTAAKVAAVAVVAATGTAALAVAENRHPTAPARVEPSPASARAPDSRVRKPLVAPVRRVPAVKPVRPAARSAKPRPAPPKAKSAQRSLQSSASTSSSEPAAPAVPAKERNTSNSRGGVGRGGSKAKVKTKPSSSHGRAKPKHEPASKTEPAAKSKRPEPKKAEAPASPPPAQEGGAPESKNKAKGA